MRYIVALILAGIAALNVPKDTWKNILPGDSKPAVKEGTIAPSLELFRKTQGPKWGKIATLARTKAFKSKQEATDMINGTLSETQEVAIAPIQGELKEATSKEDWQQELANLCDRYERESQ